jgi:hypothetical protein
MSPSNRRVAYVEEAQEETGSSIEGDENTRTYATSHAATAERPNTGRSRESRPPAELSGSSSASLDEADTDSTTRSSKHSKPTKQPTSRRDSEQRAREQAMKRRERTAVDGKGRTKTESSRPSKETHAPRTARPPPPQHAATQPIIHYQSGYARPTVDDASYYGVQPAMSGPVRPGNRRPASYYAGQPSRPPVSNPSWHHPPPFPVGTFPPPMFPPSPMMHAPMPPPPPPGLVEPQGYFDPSHEPSMQSRDRLKARFQQRPSSAMGGRPPSAMGFAPPDYEEPVGRPIGRRPSQSGRRDRERDRQDMPPPNWIPQRSNSAMPSTTPFRPPPQALQPSPLRQQRPPTSNRRSVGFVDQPQRGFADEDLIGKDDLFHDISPQPTRMRPQRGSVSYDHTDYELVLANGRNSRRSSLHGSAAVSGGGASLEDDYNVEAALRYQDRMSGGKVQVPLTEKVLREASKRGGVPSSRSTRSSASHDESDYYKRSNTTGFTRSSGGGPDDYKIKVSGAAIVRASGLEIECEGGEITFSAPSRSRSGSDRGSTVFPQIEDSQSRMGPRALAYRGRAPSQSDSQSRGYAPTHAPYEPHLTNNFF